MQQKIEKIGFKDLCRWTNRQKEALRQLRSGKRFLLYGGALGGGKSYFLRWVLLRRLLELYAKYDLKNITVMLACEDYPSLKDRQLQKIELEFPAWMGKMAHDHKTYGKAFILNPEYGGGAICFRNLDDPSKYQSSEFAAIAVDELTKNDYQTFTFLRSRLRWPGLPDYETWFLSGSNPGGVGHGWVKQFWIDKNFPEEWTEPVDFSGDFAFVPSKADDNPHLDSAYWATLQTLPPNLRPAFRDGSWDIFIGQAFPEITRETHSFKWDGGFPPNAPIYMTYDWGYGKPFSIAWWYTDADGRLYRCAEWYGWSGVPDTGLRLPDSDVAKGVIEREKHMGLDERRIYRLAGHDSWNKKPDYQGGGQGPSTAEVFAAHKLYLIKADPSRDLKLRQFRERVRVPKDGTSPMMLVAESCAQWWRTITTLPMDPKHIEEVDTNAEDHIYDEAAQVCMARPLALVQPRPKRTDTERLIDFLNQPEQSIEEEMVGAYPDESYEYSGNLINTVM